MEKPIIILSGGFDPYHAGHAAMFIAAAKLGDICVILNSDQWLIKKKGKFFMSFNQRFEVIRSIKGVEQVVASRTLSSVCEDIRNIKNYYNGRQIIFANGGDRLAHNTPELATCRELEVPMIYGLGGGKTQSSSELLERWTEQVGFIDKSTKFSDDIQMGRFDG